MSDAQQIASGNHDERMRRGVELLYRDTAMLERQVSVLREALATRALLHSEIVIRQSNSDEIERLQRENAALRSLAAAMAEEMEQHGGEQAFDSLARYRAARGKETKP